MLLLSTPAKPRGVEDIPFDRDSQRHGSTHPPTPLPRKPACSSIAFHGFIDYRACPGSFSTASLLHCASSVSLFADVSCVHLLIILLIGPADLLAAVFFVFFFFPLLQLSLEVDLTGSGRSQRTPPPPPKNPTGVDGAQAVVSQTAGLCSPFYGDMPAAPHPSRPCCMNYF